MPPSPAAAPAAGLEIPGYREALFAEQQARDLAFLLDVPRTLCGVPVRQITLRDLLLLAQADCRFITGGSTDAEDVRLFLWILNPGFVPGDRDLRASLLNPSPRFRPVRRARRSARLLTIR